MTPRPSFRRSFADSGLLLALGMRLVLSILVRGIGTELVRNGEPLEECQDVLAKDPDEPWPDAIAWEKSRIDPLVHRPTRDIEERRNVLRREQRRKIEVDLGWPRFST